MFRKNVGKNIFDFDQKKIFLEKESPPGWCQVPFVMMSLKQEMSANNFCPLLKAASLPFSCWSFNNKNLPRDSVSSHFLSEKTLHFRFSFFSITFDFSARARSDHLQKKLKQKQENVLYVENYLRMTDKRMIFIRFDILHLPEQKVYYFVCLCFAHSRLTHLVGSKSTFFWTVLRSVNIFRFE